MVCWWWTTSSARIKLYSILKTETSLTLIQCLSWTTNAITTRNRSRAYKRRQLLTKSLRELILTMFMGTATEQFLRTQMKFLTCTRAGSFKTKFGAFQWSLAQTLRILKAIWIRRTSKLLFICRQRVGLLAIWQLTKSIRGTQREVSNCCQKFQRRLGS
jgi:hypothetical protein